MPSSYLASMQAQFAYYKVLGEKAMDQVEDPQLFYSHKEDSNSLAVIVKHLWGNMLSRWTGFLDSDGEKPWRDREGEFVNEPSSRAEVYRLWEEGWKCLFDALAGLKEEDLERVVYIRNMGHTVMEAINRQLAHYSYHVGQIVFLSKLLCEKPWASLSIPRGNSAQYNAAKFAKPKHKEHFTEEFLPGGGSGGAAGAGSGRMAGVGGAMAGVGGKMRGNEGPEFLGREGGWTGEEEVIIEVVIPASVERVWKAWADPVSILSWIGSDPEGRGLEAKMDVRPGGEHVVSFANSDGTEHQFHGIYKEVEAGSRLVFSWEWKNEPGVVSQVTVLLKAEGDGTRMHFRHANLGTGSAHDYLPGWERTFEKLKRVLAGTALAEPAFGKAEVISQHKAALKMLMDTIVKCPDSLWDSGEYEVAYWRIVYHALFYISFYSSESPDQFVPWPKHQVNYNYLGNLSLEGQPFVITDIYSKANMLDCAEYIMGRLGAAVASTDFASRCGFEWLEMNNLEKHLYTIRHTQHHAGQLIERLHFTGIKGIRWERVG